MNIILDRGRKTPIYLQIKNEIKRMIFEGELLAHEVLPPERRLAEELGVNRSTVLSAYRELKAEGLIDAHMGQGTQVMPIGVIEESDMKTVKQFLYPISWQHLMSQEAFLSNETGIIDLLKMSGKSDVISFAAGIAAPELYPIKEMENLSELFQEQGYRPFLHTAVEGLYSLREKISEFMSHRQIKAAVEDIMVLSGSQQGLDLIARSFIDPGDTVIVEEPTYIGALQIFKALGARVIGVPIQEDGLRMDILEALIIKHQPKLIYTIPTFQNPSGRVMSLIQRKKLLELSYRYQTPIIEDDAYSELRFEGEELPSLKALDQMGNVLYLNTFSKFIFPGLRIGWMIAPPAVIKQMAIKRQMIDLHANSLGQYLICNYLEKNSIMIHIEKIRKQYCIRRDAMAKALDAYAPNYVKWSLPEGGFYIWCELPEELDASKIWIRANDAGVVFVPGEVFYTGKQGQNFMRLNFSFPTPVDIKKGIKILMGVIEEVMEQAIQPEGRNPLEINPIY